jgi:hypothetical protein
MSAIERIELRDPIHWPDYSTNAKSFTTVLKGQLQKRLIRSIRHEAPWIVIEDERGRINRTHETNVLEMQYVTDVAEAIDREKPTKVEGRKMPASMGG